MGAFGTSHSTSLQMLHLLTRGFATVTKIAAAGASSSALMAENFQHILLGSGNDRIAIDPKLDFPQFPVCAVYVAVQKISSAAMNSRARSSDRTARPRGPPLIHRCFQSDQ